MRLMLHASYGAKITENQTPLVSFASQIVLVAHQNVPIIHRIHEADQICYSSPKQKETRHLRQNLLLMIHS